MTKIDDYYDIILTKSYDNPQLFFAVNPVADKWEYLQDFVGNEAVVEDPAPNRRCYFAIRSQDRQEVLCADRIVDLGSVTNFRDQGGYLTQDGRTVKYGRFFRGSALHGLSPQDKSYLDAMGLRTILDYRDQGEHDRAPDYLPGGAVHKLVPAIRKQLGERNQAEVRDLESHISTITSQAQADEAFEKFTDIYRQLPFHNPAYRTMFDALDSADTVPLYQHCTMGKDRTGVGCAMLLMALGVDRNTAMGDYCLSATYRARANQRHIESFAQQCDNPFAIELLKKSMTVERSYLQLSFDEIDRRYPNFERFLQEEYNIQQDRLDHWRQLHLYN